MSPGDVLVSWLRDPGSNECPGLIRRLQVNTSPRQAFG